MMDRGCDASVLIAGSLRWVGLESQGQGQGMRILHALATLLWDAARWDTSCGNEDCCHACI